MKPLLSAPDLALLVGYFLLVGWISRRVSGHEKDTEGYLLGSREVPWWAVLCSIVGTEISALTFVGVPAMAYAEGGDWTYLQLALGAILARVAVSTWFVPAYYHHKVVSIYQFLLWRFGPATRNLAASIFLVTRVLMSGVRLYAGCLIVQSALGLSVEQAVVLVAALGLAYTFFGGIKAVIWTEVIQVMAMAAGLLTAAAVLLWSLPDGLAAVPAARMRLLNTSLDPSQEFTIWAALIGSTIGSTAVFGTDYDMVQRMLTAPDGARSRKAVIGSGLADIPIAGGFLFIGTLLWAYHQAHPDPLWPIQAKEVFPYFIVHHLPVGLAGLVVAGVLSVVLSSFESALNALSGSFVIDLYRPYLAPGRNEAHYLGATRAASVAFCLALIGVAIACQGVDQILPFGLEVGTYFYGALLAVFAVGLFTRGGSDRACASSIPVSVLTVMAVKLHTNLAFPWFVTLGCATGVIWSLVWSSLPGWGSRNKDTQE